MHNFTATEAQVAAEEIEKLEKDSKLMSRATLEAFRPSELGMSFSAPTNRVSNPMFIERASLQLQTPLMPPGPLPEHITDSAI
ncbi:hypothetical protein EON65_10180 [archaeon]|nr:MAG: hypothetical protein EON65_10180 [archaeon]